MKTKKSPVKQKKKKPANDVSKSGGIQKSKKVKEAKKIKNNKKDLILETLKKDVDESQTTKKPILNRQIVWNSFLKTFNEVEKLNKRQKQIMEFCANKSLTPPKRKRKFLNFIRHSFPHQGDVTDEQVNELFDLLLKKYDDFKSGTYSSAKLGESNNHDTKVKLSVNKRKKLKRAAEKALQNNTNAVVEDDTAKQFEKVGSRKRKRPKIAKMDVEENHD